MKKKDVYKLIEYNGEYNNKVKKNLKKLIKKYHPDKNNGDDRFIKVIYEVKKELERNNVSYKVDNDNLIIENKFKNNYAQYANEIISLNTKKVLLDEELDNLYKTLSKEFKNYSNIYADYCCSCNELCCDSDKLKKIMNTSFHEVICYIIIIIFLIAYLFLQNFFVLILLLFMIVGIIVIRFYKYNEYKKLNSEVINSKNKQKLLENKVAQLRKILDEKSSVIREKEREINLINNNIRYYKNQMEDKKDVE